MLDVKDLLGEYDYAVNLVEGAKAEKQWVVQQIIDKANIKGELEGVDAEFDEKIKAAEGIVSKKAAEIKASGISETIASEHWQAVPRKGAVTWDGDGLVALAEVLSKAGDTVTAAKILACRKHGKGSIVILPVK